MSAVYVSEAKIVRTWSRYLIYPRSSTRRS